MLKDKLLTGRNLFLLASGTGLAPFMSIISDPDYYEAYEHIVLVHGVRLVSELGYQAFITQDLPQHEYLGDVVTQKLIYCPTVTREPYERRGRITDLLQSGELTRAFQLPDLDAALDRVMICGNPSLLTDLVSMLQARGFTEGTMNTQGSYVIERAFVEK